MNLKMPVSALLITESDGQDRRAKYALNAFRAFICSRLRTDVGSYSNAAMYVAGDREKELLIALSNEKSADLEELDAGCSEQPIVQSKGNGYETPSYTQYIIDVDFELLIDMDAVSNFVYCREFKTLELFQRLEKSNDDFDTKDLLNDAIRRQRESILRLDAKLAELRNNTFAFNESDRAEFSLVPVP